jgi:hypothetical protein
LDLLKPCVNFCVEEAYRDDPVLDGGLLDLLEGVYQPVDV